MSAFVCLLLAFLAQVVLADVRPEIHEKKFDRVKSLPGWNFPLKSKMYSGLMKAGKSCVDGECHKMQEHYIFIESERDPWTDPVVLWTNGGPGAASLFGLFVELGPYMLSDDSLRTAHYNKTGTPTLFNNPYSWTAFANLLIINSPPPVGFSFCDPPGPAGEGTSCGSWNDTRTAFHNLEFLVNWFAAYPEFASNDFYLTGESYAGIYVPTLARAILEWNKDVANQPKMNLKGFAVGDACVGSEVNCGAEGPGALVEFMRGHGQFSHKTYQSIMTTCTSAELNSDGDKSPQCQASLDRMGAEIGGYFEYSLYDECWYENDLISVQAAPWGGRKRKYWSKVRARRRTKSSLNERHVGEWTDGYPCGGDDVLYMWQNLSEVRTSLNVYQHSNFFSGDNGEGFVYNLTERSLLDFYREVVSEGLLRVLVYVGDSDPSVNMFDAERWTTSLGFQELEGWRPWTMDGVERMGGSVTRYVNDFDFLTIRGAGHMVPEYKPWAASVMISSWLAGRDWPRYNPRHPNPQGPEAEGKRLDPSVGQKDLYEQMAGHVA